jgi:DNA replication factor GINS
LVLPGDFYSKLASYSQKLKRSTGSGSSEVIIRLAEVQTRLLQSMVRQLLSLRLKKARQNGVISKLLPEEKYISSAEQKFERRLSTMVEAVSQGKPSFVEFANRTESQRNVTVKFVKHVNELVGLDMRRYGPYEVDDVASMPAASADVLIVGGDAVEVYTREDS